MGRKKETAKQTNTLVWNDERLYEMKSERITNIYGEDVVKISWEQLLGEEVYLYAWEVPWRKYKRNHIVATLGHLNGPRHHGLSVIQNLYDRDHEKHKAHLLKEIKALQGK